MSDLKYTINFWDRKRDASPDGAREATATSLSVANLPDGTIKAMRGDAQKGPFFLPAGTDHSYVVFPLGESFTLSKIPNKRREDVFSTATFDLAVGLNPKDFETIAIILKRAMAALSPPVALNAQRTAEQMEYDFITGKYAIEDNRGHAHGTHNHSCSGQVHLGPLLDLGRPHAARPSQGLKNSVS